MLKSISDPQPNLIKNWTHFVENHPNGNIFQTPYLYNVYKSSHSYDPILLLTVDESEKIQGVLVGLVQKFRSGWLESFARRSIVWGAPLINNNNPDILDFTLKEYDRLFSTKVLYTEFRNLWEDSINTKYFNSNKFTHVDHLDITFDLTKEESELWNNMSSTRRRQINRSIRRGTLVKQLESGESDKLDKCFNLISEVYKKAKLPIPDQTLFMNAVDKDYEGRYLKIFTAINDNKIIGVRYVLCFNGTIYDWFAGSDKEYQDKYANDLLPWEVIKWGHRQKMCKFDFGGAGKPGIPYGVRDYKLKFGGSLHNFGRYQKNHHPYKMKIAKIGYKFWKMFSK